MTSLRACLVSGYPSGLDNRLLSRTDRAHGGTIGTEAVVNSPADGYTLLLSSPANAIHATLYDKLNYNFMRDIRPVAHLAGAPLVLVVHPSVPARSIPAFVAHVNANPGKINMASAGIGSTPHVTGELFKMMAKADMMHVPYRGAGPAMTDLLGGQVQVLFDNVPSAIEYIGLAGCVPLGSPPWHARRLCRMFRNRRFRAGLRGKCLVRH